MLVLLGNRYNKSREPGDFMNNSTKKEIVFSVLDIDLFARFSGPKHSVIRGFLKKNSLYNPPRNKRELRPRRRHGGHGRSPQLVILGRHTNLRQFIPINMSAYVVSR